MLRKLLCCSVLCGAIGCASSDLRTPLGIDVFFLEDAVRYSAEEIDAIVHRFRQEMGYIEVDGMNLLLTPDRFDCSGVLAVGCTYNSRAVEIATTSQCLAATSLAHELIHIYEVQTTGGFDYRHESAYWREPLVTFYDELKKGYCNE